MAEAARTEASPLLCGLPDEIVIWEILVRVPPEALLRCRAVCRAWRRATSTVDFLLAHHDRQPCLPLLREDVPYSGGFLNIIAFDHRRAASAAAPQLRDVATLDDDSYDLRACCDGLLILSKVHPLHPPGVFDFSVCNPATRQYALLPLIHDFMLLGMYPHAATGEYRLLLRTFPYQGDRCYVSALGSDQPPRQIGRLPTVVVELYGEPVMFRGCLHWYPELYDSQGSMILVFDTTAESFQEMHTPAVSGLADLFEADGMLGMSSFNDTDTIIDIWVLP